MFETGKITNVWFDDVGSELVVDAASATSALMVDDAYDFNALGGTLRLTSDTASLDATYVSVDFDLDLIQLAGPLAATWTAGTQVLVLPAGQQMKAMVDLDDSDEGIVAIVPSGMDSQMVDGIRDEADQEAVTITDDSGRWEVSNVDDERGVVQGTNIDMTGVEIPPYSPVAPPGTSPQITVSGNASSLVIEADNVEAGTSIKYYISTVDGFTPGPTNLYANTQATVVVVNSLPGSTSPLLPETPYYVVAQATNIIGDSPDFSDQVSDTLHTDVLAQTILAELVAGFILTGKIQVGQAYISADEGIVIPQPDGGVITFPVNGAFAQITAKLIARSINVTDNFTLNGSNNQVFGQLTFGEGIVKPQIPPTLSGYNKSYHAFDVLGSNVYQGMLEDPINAGNWLFPFAFFGTGVRSVSKSGLLWNGDLTIAGLPTGNSFNTTFQPFGGMIYATGTSRYVMLGTGAASAGGTATSWWLVTFSRTGSTLNYTGRLEIGDITVFPYQPRMGYNANTGDGYIYYMNSNADNKLRVVRFTPSSTPTRDPGAIAYATALAGKYNIGGVYVGNADFGAQRIIVSLKGSTQMVFTGGYNTLVRSANDDWVRPASSVMDITWDGTRFWTFDDGGNLWKHSTNKAPSGRNTVPIQARHTWYDNNGTTHETDGGPIETLSLGARQWLRVETDPAPDTNGDPLDAEKADTIRVYASNDGVTLPRLQTADGWSGMATPTVLRKKTRAVLVNTVSGSNVLDAANVDYFVQDDVGATVTGSGIPVGATITSVDINGITAKMSANATATASFVSATVTPSVSTRVGLYESINNANAAPPAVNGFASVGRAPGAFKSTRTDANGPLIVAKGDGSGRMGPFQWDNLGKTMVDFGPERPGTILVWPSASIPLDCTLLEGQAIKRPTMAGGNGAAGNAAANNAAGDVAPFIRIWQLFGTTFGAGDGTTTFNLPDLRRRSIIGVSTVAATLALAQNEGDTIANRSFSHNHTHSHTHTIAGQAADGTPQSPGTAAGSVPRNATYGGHAHGGDTGAASTATTSTAPATPYLGLYYIMKL